MRHFAFYISDKPAKDRYSLPLPGVGTTGIRWAYIRVEEIENVADELEALDRAEPREDESVMNTHSFED